ncbi:uncharacterized protein LOC110847025 isoform X2 [Folsomia candida]|uniref:uncharacterized protein LOC110847025 isoform X2 n=1 Tax=Folsomia candida TaxID=158441 RepID=UPI001604A216|nr:uncharacterized protein LOC110847025 isoform X2 [Folsomia candida]
MQLIGPNSSPVQEDDESSPELVLTQEDKGLTDEQREELFTVIFTRGGRVPVIGKPDWNIIIHKSPENGIIHLCIEYLSNHKRGFLYKAERLCTKRNCYQNKNTLSSDVLPKCLLHRDRWMYSVATVTDYEERDVLAQLYVGKNVLHYQTWKDYSDQKKVKNSRLIPKVLSINHFENEEDALKRLSFETTIGMFMKLAPSTPFVNLDNLIPLCHGMEREIDERLKEMGMELKIRRQLTPDEKKVLEYPLGEYLYGSGAVSEQKAEKGKAFLYVIHSRDMWYFGWSDTPGFQNRLKRDEKTDGASMYKKITEERAKLSGMRAPTITCSLLAKCDKKEATKIEAKMIISGYIAYLLGCHNPLRRLPSSQCYSTNKCVSLSLIDSDSWGEIVDFVKFFWGVEPMLAKF